MMEFVVPLTVLTLGVVAWRGAAIVVGDRGEPS